MGFEPLLTYKPKEMKMKNIEASKIVISCEIAVKISKALLYISAAFLLAVVSKLGMLWGIYYFQIS